MSLLTVGSLFSGIGGIDLGLERAGFQLAWQVEIDAYCQKVLAKHWPDVTRYGDIRECGKHNLTPVDLICGGFPCQDISNAGKKRGIEGSRSGLWSEFYRIICELRPQYILVENVAALLERGISRVLGDLATSGYDAEWQCLRASDFGAPHQRERIFIIAYSNSIRCSTSRLLNLHNAIPTYKAWHASQNIKHWQGWKHWVSKSVQNGLWDESTTSLLGMDDGLPFRMERVERLGNAVVPQVAEYIGHCILNALEAEQEVAG